MGDKRVLVPGWKDLVGPAHLKRLEEIIESEVLGMDTPIGIEDSRLGHFFLSNAGKQRWRFSHRGRVEDKSLKEKEAIDLQGRSPKKMSCHQPTNRGVSSVDILCLKIDQRKEIEAEKRGSSLPPLRDVVSENTTPEEKIRK